MSNVFTLAKRALDANRSPSRVTCSCITTASAPAGTTAPVKMRTACPCSSAGGDGSPAFDSPATRSTTGESPRAPNTSLERMA
ncbi:MAG: hypothetical protein R3A78_14565 [Polyangiales bacterium]